MDTDLREALDALGNQVRGIAHDLGAQLATLGTDVRAAREDAHAAREEARGARDEAHAARDETKSLSRIVGAFADEMRHLGKLIEIIASEQARIATSYAEFSERLSTMMGLTIKARTDEAERYKQLEQRLAELERAVTELRAGRST